MSETIRKWVQFGMTAVLFIVGTYLYVTGKTNVPPPPPPVFQVPTPASLACTCPPGGHMDTSAAGDAERKFGSPVLRALLCKRLIESAVAKGADKTAATTVVNNLDFSSPLLDWLFNGGFARLLELVMELIALYKAPN